MSVIPLKADIHQRGLHVRLPRERRELCDAFLAALDSQGAVKTAGCLAVRMQASLIGPILLPIFSPKKTPRLLQTPSVWSAKQATMDVTTTASASMGLISLLGGIGTS
jgi:hypothetical protein